MESRQDYLNRLADIDARVEQARVGPDVVLARAAGLLAGRAGCRVDEAHAHLLEMAAEQGRAAQEVAAELLAAAESRMRAGPDRLRAVVDGTFGAPPRADHDPGRPVSGPRPAPADWALLVQQVLDVTPGRHVLLVPVRGGTGGPAGAGAGDRGIADQGAESADTGGAGIGEAGDTQDAGGAGDIEDYVFVAVSPSVVDMSGRRGAQIVGRRVSEIYPTIVGGAVWEAWCDAIADGTPREVGPISYVSPADQAPADVSLTVRVHPIGDGLLNSWVRHDEEMRLSERIAHTERLGNLGWGEWDLVTGKVTWSEGLYRIYERDPADGPMPSEESEALTLPEDIPLRQQAVERFGRGEAVDMVYRIRIGDRVKHVRTVADADRDSGGRPVKVYGIIQDVTARETSRARLTEIERQLREQRRSLAAEHRLTVQLQQIVLPVPDAPVDLPGLRFAVRYLPAEQASRVGGDWYHAAVAGDGSVILAVGDVAGHGLHAAASMARLRHALDALTVTTTSRPAELLSFLNRLLYSGSPAADGMPVTATAAVARYDPSTGELVWAQAGHPTPLRTRGGVTAELDRPPGPLLGAFPDARYATATTALGPGDLLLFYTDGLIEQRDRSMEEGLAPVVATLDRISAEGGEHPLADLLAQLHHANPDDDACVLAARPLAAPGGALNSMRA
ncbi:PP2C family protein-serine/threonine phosphatase [Planobispora siamensis]|uniref:PPM-type phosphatase domain-containing protein n=1 Tax=Planobispora siamensis TaxID=936338 RepID=A0A8J3WPB7_9ACTN|nr:PP2C family protein-serine/threonine phosphatase [Planobispora siamensis]GIH96725.1 hypothetical protein Psi01_73550 [Planobispora siamensis]